MYVILFIKKIIRILIPAILAIIFLIIVTIVGMCQIFYENIHFMDFASNQEMTLRTGTALNLSADCEAYRGQVQQLATASGIGEYTDLLMAIMMQESGGRAKDVFQCSESLGLPVGTLSTEASIEQAIKLVTDLIRTCNVKSPGDEAGIRLLLQSYNFGSGYSKYAIEHGGGWTQQNTYDFAEIKSKGKRRSEAKAAIVGPWAYGDQHYTDHVLRYYSFGTTINYSDQMADQMVDPGLAGGIAKSERMKYLFPNGTPTSNAAMQKYLTTISVPIINAQGRETTMKITCHRLLASDIYAAFEDMKNIGFPILASETACQNWRTMSSNHNKISYHSYGICIDINWNHNPYTKTPGAGYSPYTDPYAITPEVVSIWKSHGFYWGGDWTSAKDYMHMTYTGN